MGCHATLGAQCFIGLGVCSQQVAGHNGTAAAAKKWPVGSGKTGTGESPPLPRPRLGLACILVYRSLPQVVARKRPPPPPNFHHPICVSDLVSRPGLNSSLISALDPPSLDIRRF